MLLYSNNKRVVKSFKTLEERFRNTHGNKYDYSYVVYRGNNIKVCITCPIHGDFYQLPNNHLKCGCGKCARANLPQCTAGTKEVFESRARIKHNGRYDYSKFVYINARVPGVITCNIHGDFKQTPDNHVRGGDGCPRCKSLRIHKDAKNLKGRLYIIYLVHSKLYKIGITTATLTKRNRFIKEPWEVLHEDVYSSIYTAYKVEQYLLSKYAEYMYKGSSVLASGNTELLISIPKIATIQKHINEFMKEHELT